MLRRTGVRGESSPCPASGESRAAFQSEFGIKSAPDLVSLLNNPDIKGVILTVPNEQHLLLAREVAKSGKHVYTEKPIASTLEEGLAIEELEVCRGTGLEMVHARGPESYGLALRHLPRRPECADGSLDRALRLRCDDRGV